MPLRYVFPIVLDKFPAAERDDVALDVSKTLPQRLKPQSMQAIYGTVETLPFVQTGFTRRAIYLPAPEIFLLTRKSGKRSRY